MTNLAENLVAAATEHPHRPAIRLDDHVISYAELHRAASAITASLGDGGLEPGERVGLVVPNVPAFATLFYGCCSPAGPWCR